MDHEEGWDAREAKETPWSWLRWVAVMAMEVSRPSEPGAITPEV